MADIFADYADVMYDSYGRHLHYLRVSLTDACNLRCVYCMPEDIVFRPQATLLQDDEILTLVRVAASLGVDKVRLTGGEPTVRCGVVDLVRRIRAAPGIRRLAMTTNGVRLAELAGPLAEAGLDQVNISIDSLDPDKFRRITRRGDLTDVWRGIEAAEAAGLRPLKLNCVVTRGFNDTEVVDLARLTLDRPWHVRFIEMMPLGKVADFQQSQVVPSAETRARVEAELGPLTPVSEHAGHDPARPYRLSGALGQLGFISSVTGPFCEGCTRLRLTADGKLRLCLLRDDEVDLLTPLRAGADFETLRRIMAEAAFRKPWGHRLEEHDIAMSREMSQIGG
ncbi:MAG: GTP 3',8-cyclase MoaA [Chloroflexi bacterium HGW-Chloroflexi-1]|nr:MAG: GTP 3',8-cyclase MoaA [Chloroflexi bacterium HGW-Chloroflexi-1]